MRIVRFTTGDRSKYGILEGKSVRSQEVLYRQACEAIEEARNNRRTRFEPHRPDGGS